jgi:hypothetical protein
MRHLHIENDFDNFFKAIITLLKRIGLIRANNNTQVLNLLCIPKTAMLSPKLTEDIIRGLKMIFLRHPNKRTVLLSFFEKWDIEVEKGLHQSFRDLNGPLQFAKDLGGYNPKDPKNNHWRQIRGKPPNRDPRPSIFELTKQIEAALQGVDSSLPVGNLLAEAKTRLSGFVVQISLDHLCIRHPEHQNAYRIDISSNPREDVEPISRQNILDFLYVEEYLTLEKTDPEPTPAEDSISFSAELPEEILSALQKIDVDDVTEEIEQLQKILPEYIITIDGDTVYFYKGDQKICFFIELA